MAFGTTFPSDSRVFISYPFISAAAVDKDFSTIWATSYPGGFLGIPSTELSSYRGRNPGLQLGNTFAFNFGDLAPNHVPADAYEGMGFCAGHPYDQTCKTIFEDRYAPNLVYPTQFKDFDPRFKSCAFDQLGIFDPPTALGTVAALTTQPTSTTTNVPQATPAQTANPTIDAPTQTALPEVTSSTANGDSSTPADSATTVGFSSAAATTITFNSASPTPSTQAESTNAQDPSSPPTVQPTVVPADPNASSPPTVQSTAAPADPQDPSNPSATQAVPLPGASPTIAQDPANPTTAQPTVAAGTFPATTDVTPEVAKQADTSSPSSSSVIPLGNNGNSGSLATNPVAATLTVGTDTITASAVTVSGTAQVFAVGSTTLSVGGAAATLSDGNVVSADSSGLVIQSGSTSAAPLVATLTVNGQTITASQIQLSGSIAAVVVGGTTLTAGGPAATLSDGHVVSAGLSGLVVDPGTQPLVATFSIGGQAVTATETTVSGGKTAIVLGNTTLTVGGRAKTLSNGQVISAASSGLVIDAATTSKPSNPSHNSSTTPGPTDSTLSTTPLSSANPAATSSTRKSSDSSSSGARLSLLMVTLGLMLMVD